MRSRILYPTSGGFVRILLFAGVVALAAILAARADTQTPEIEDKRAQAAQVQAEIQATLQAVAESQAAYNQAQAELQVVNAQLRQNAGELQRTERELQAAQERLSERARSAYRSGGVAFLDVLLSVRSFGEFSRRVEFVFYMIQEDRAAVQEAQEIRDRLAGQRAELRRQQGQQAQLVTEMRQSRAAIEVRLQQQREMLDSLNAEVAQLVREEQARQAREAAERRAELAARAAEERREQNRPVTATVPPPQPEPAPAEPQPEPAPEPPRAAAAEPVPPEPEAPVEEQYVEPETPAEEQYAEPETPAEEQYVEPVLPEPEYHEPEAPVEEQYVAEEQYSFEDQSAVQEQYAEPVIDEPAYHEPEEAAEEAPVEEEEFAPQPADPTAQALLENPNITMYPGVREDIASGNVDPRVLEVIAFAASRYTITISTIKTGHPYADSPTLDALGYYGFPNAHYFYRAVDISAVNGAPVSPGNSAAYELAAAIYSNFAPEELGSPWAFGPGSFVDALHQDHIHVGWTYAADGGI